MSRTEKWIAEGKIALFVARQLPDEEMLEIFEEAKIDPELQAAIFSARIQLLTTLVGQAATQDPALVTESGLLEGYADDTITDEQRTFVELMSVAHPVVNDTMDSLKRGRSVEAFLNAHELGAQAIIDSTLLMDYLLTECTPAEKRLVELAIATFPEVAAEFAHLERDHSILDTVLVAKPSEAARQRVINQWESKYVPNNGWGGLKMPDLHGGSKPEDFAPWINWMRNAPHAPETNLFVCPIDGSREKLTLYVSVRQGLEEEVHIDSIERFLVVEGSCYIAFNGQEVHLQQGDYYSIPKFTAHTVVVTSQIPCKLIVQQVAA